MIQRCIPGRASCAFPCWACGIGCGNPARRLAFVADEQPPVGEFHFVQISDSHIGFGAEANRDVTATLQVAIDRIAANRMDPSSVPVKGIEGPDVRIPQLETHPSLEWRHVR